MSDATSQALYGYNRHPISATYPCEAACEPGPSHRHDRKTPASFGGVSVIVAKARGASLIRDTFDGRDGIDILTALPIVIGVQAIFFIRTGEP